MSKAVKSVDFKRNWFLEPATTVTEEDVGGTIAI